MKLIGLGPLVCLTAIKLSVYRNAKPQLGIGNLPAKLWLGVPSRADFTLNLLAVLVCLAMLSCTSESAKVTDDRSPTELYMLKGVQYMENGRLDVAQQDLERAVELDDKSTEAHNLLGVLYERINRLEDAEGQFSRALSLDEKNFAAPKKVSLHSTWTER